MLFCKCLYSILTWLTHCTLKMALYGNVISKFSNLVALFAKTWFGSRSVCLNKNAETSPTHIILKSLWEGVNKHCFKCCRNIEKEEKKLKINFSFKKYWQPFKKKGFGLRYARLSLTLNLFHFLQRIFKRFVGIHWGAKWSGP